MSDRNQEIDEIFHPLESRMNKQAERDTRIAALHYAVAHTQPLENYRWREVLEIAEEFYQWIEPADPEPPADSPDSGDSEEAGA